MKKITLISKLLLAMLLNYTAQGGTTPAAAPQPTGQASTPIPWSEIGAKAGADYKGDGLAVTPTTDGARLHCVFQQLEGEATSQGLWLTSTVKNKVNDRFQVKAAAVGRASAETLPLADSGLVKVAEKLVAFARPGLQEEYTVSMDGVRQDFVVLEKPAGAGALRVRLAVTGATVSPTVGGANLVLPGSGRKIAYGRLRVTDAGGRELAARMEVAAAGLAVVVEDGAAVYPVRIDPTFTDVNWVSMGGMPGANDVVYAAVVDGSGNLYIGGDFTLVGETNANHIAKWNGSSWSALGSGVDNRVLALAVSGSDVYAGGLFSAAGGSAANHIAKWDGSNWSALGSGASSTVIALAVSGSDVYAGGLFSAAGGSAANKIAKWNGSNWSALGSGMNSDVLALAVSGTDLYAGGAFTTADGSAANHIAKWNGSSWSALDSGMNDSVRALAVSGSDLYAGGYFTTAGGSSANRIAKWNGSSWSALGSGMDQTVYALAVSGSDLYAGGEFVTAGGSDAYYIAKWNGSSWSAVGIGMTTFVHALAVSGSDVYAGGYFDDYFFGPNFDLRAAKKIAKWNGSSWSALGSGFSGRVYALAVLGGDVYAGGEFTTAGGGAANYIAKWNGSSWSALGSGMNDPVYALAVSGSDLYAAGIFSTAGGSSANGIAKWNGSSWSALGSGIVGSYVNALAVSGSDLYAGGEFTTAGGVAATNIAKWNGSSWSALGSGFNGRVYALAVSGSDVYAGGEFTTAGGSAANYIAKWNGSSWSALGSGMGGTPPFVNALAVLGGDLYAGGYFTTAGGSAANYIAKWNGSSWSALGSEIIGFGHVHTLVVSDTNLFVGGYFAAAGGSAANNIAKWNGSSWSALGSGMNYFGTVLTLAVSGSDVYAGGEFTMAGGKVSCFAAKVVLTEVECPTISLNGTLPNGTTGATYTNAVTASGGIAGYTYAMTLGGVPPGLILTSGGSLEGTPTSTGTTNFTITATDANGCTGTSNYTVTITCPTITLGALPGAPLGEAYSHWVGASGGHGAYTFAVTQGNLPAGFTLESDGTLHGSSVIPASTNITIAVTDGFGCQGSSNYTFTASCLVITLSGVPNAIKNVKYLYPVLANGTAAGFTFFVTAGALPPGLTLTNDTGKIGGKATVYGVYNFTLMASNNAAGCMGTRAYSMYVNKTSAPDIKAPTVKIVFPTANAVVTNTPPVLVTGTVADDVLVTNVEYNLDGSGWTTSTLQSATNFSVSIGSLASGLHSVSVRATDLAGNVTTPVKSVNFHYGTHSFVNQGGIYYGLFSETAGVATNSAGFAKIVVTAKEGKQPTFSATLWVDGKKHVKAGKFEMDGIGTFTSPIDRTVITAGPLTASLTLPLVDGATTLGGSILNQTTVQPGEPLWTADLTANQCLTNAGTVKVPIAGSTNWDGTYTVVVPSFGPEIGDGYSPLIITNGIVKLAAGKLADNQAFTLVTAPNLSAAGDWPVFVQSDKIAGRGQSILYGWISVPSFSGSLNWIKGANQLTYPAGFNTNVTVAASTYGGDPGATLVLPLNNVSPTKATGNVDLNNGGLTTNIVNSITLTNKGTVNKFIDNLYTKVNHYYTLSLALTPKTGALGGTFKNVGNGASITAGKITGIVMTNQFVGRGYFIATMPAAGTSSGTFLLTP